MCVTFLQLAEVTLQLSFSRATRSSSTASKALSYTYLYYLTRLRIYLSISFILSIAGVPGSPTSTPMTGASRGTSPTCSAQVPGTSPSCPACARPALRPARVRTTATKKPLLLLLYMVVPSSHRSSRERIDHEGLRAMAAVAGKG